MQQMQEPSLFETNESAQSALQSNSTSKSVLDLGVSSAKNSSNFKKGNRQILCQNSQNTFNSGLKVNDNFQNTINLGSNSNDTAKNTLNIDYNLNSNSQNSLNIDTKKQNNLFEAEKSELNLNKNSQMSLNANLHLNNKSKNALISAQTDLISLESSDIVDFSKELEQERILSQKQGQIFKPMLRYNKQPFSVLIFPNFTSLDFNLFMCFCFAAKEKNNSKIKITYNDLNYLMGRFDERQSIVEKNLKRLFDKFEDFIEKAMKTIIKVSISNGNYKINSYTGFFDFIQNFEKEKCIVIKFNEFMVSALNGFKFTRYYTEFELKQYCALSSKYAKRLYILLMNNLYTKQSLKIDKDELIKYLGLNANFYKKYTQKLKENILEVIKADINEHHLFKVELQYKAIIGKNKKILGYEFIYE